MYYKILVVDDSEEDRFTLRHRLRKPEHQIDVIEAETAQDAFDIIKANTDISCLFLDYMLPDMDGIMMLKQIYDRSTDTCGFPVVMLTGQGSEAVMSDAIRFGAQDYLVKDHITTDALYIAMYKANEIFELKQNKYEAQARLERSQKMEAMGNLTGGIAHDFNNLLTIMIGNVVLLQDMLTSDPVDTEKCLERVDTIDRASKRGADLVRQLMVFSRQRSLDPSPVDINSLLTDLESLLLYSLGGGVELHSELDDDIYIVDLDASQFENAIINMAVNARDAVPDEGVFTLKTSNVSLDVEDAESLGITVGEYVRLDVLDNGSGIKDDLLQNIFDPFFTTKEVGKGTGLGLSMVYGFVKDSGGGIDVKNSEDGGACFSLYFPKSVRANTLKPEDVEIKRHRRKAEGTILIVEDEPEIRALNSDLLWAQGYKVVEAASGDEGLALLQQNLDSVDLIFTDIVMPGEMNGVQMVARAQVLKPEIKFLFTTGYAKGAIPDMALAEAYDILNKPFKPDDLLDHLDRIMRG